MKKILSIMLGLSIAVGACTLYAAGDAAQDTTKTKKAKAKKTKAKKTTEEKK